MKDILKDEFPVPEVVERGSYQAKIDALRMREKAHTRESDAIAAARRRLPMVKVDGATPLIGKNGPTTLLDAFEGRRLLVTYYFMWHEGEPAPEQCEGCTFFTDQVHALSILHSRKVTYATFCQGPYDAGARYHKFLGWEMPWYSVQDTSLERLLAGRPLNMMYIICYLRQGSDVYETYWTTRRGVEAMGNIYRLLDMTVYGRQEKWEESPEGWPQLRQGIGNMRDDGRPIPHWRRLEAGHSDDLGTG